MATVDETLGSPVVDDEGFTHADAEEVLADGDLVGPESADPVLSKPDPDVFTSKDLKEEAEDGGKGAHNLKSTLLIPGTPPLFHFAQIKEEIFRSFIYNSHLKMATVDETLGSPVVDDEGFTHADAEEVLADGDLVGPESADPVLSKPDPDVFTSKDLKEEAEDGGKGAHNLKSTLLISGAVVAVLGAIFAIAKKIKEA